MPDPTIKGITFSEPALDGSSLRIAIVHSRWNEAIIKHLLQGAISKLKATGVKEDNIVVQSVPGSYELPLAVSKCVKLSPRGSQTQSDLSLHKGDHRLKSPGGGDSNRPPRWAQYWHSCSIAYYHACSYLRHRDKPSIGSGQNDAIPTVRRRDRNRRIDQRRNDAL